MVSPVDLRSDTVTCRGAGQGRSDAHPLTLTLTLAVLVMVGCAAPRNVVRVEDVLGLGQGPQRAAAPAPAPAPAPKGPTAPPAVAAAPPAAPPPVTTEALRNALVDFQFAAEEARRAARAGGSMSGPAAQHWQDVLKLVDSYLAQTGPRVSPEQLAQARAILETELERDAAVYGDFPPALADSITEHEAQLAVRVLQLHPPEWKRDSRLKFEWPVEPVRVTSLFGRRFHPIERRYKPHEGVDLAAEQGQLVSAAGPGLVRRAGWVGNYGYQVEVVHGGGVVTRYSHLLQPLVEAGDSVDAGDAVGLVGSTGHSTGPHLHFEIWRRGKPLDPLREMRFVSGLSAEVRLMRQGRARGAARPAQKPLKVGVAERGPGAPSL